MQQRSGGRAARENESAQRRQHRSRARRSSLRAARRRRPSAPPSRRARRSMARIGEPRAEREQIALDRDRASRRSRRRACVRADDAEPGVQLVDVAVRVDARVGLRHARAVEQPRLAAVAGLGVDMRSQPVGISIAPVPRDSPAAASAAARHRPQRQWFRRRLLAWYRATAATLPWRETRDPVSHPRLRGHAAADAGRSRAAEVPRVASTISVARRARRRARSTTSSRPGIRSATTSGRAACRRSRARRWRATAASCPATRRRCSRSRASARTPPARS